MEARTEVRDVRSKRFTTSKHETKQTETVDNRQEKRTTHSDTQPVACAQKQNASIDS